jgi:inward rectifier potassium channel
VSTQILLEDEKRDLGFGSVVTRESRRRLLNRDGSFNVERTGLSFWSTLSPYHSLLTMPWWKFHLLVAWFYLTANVIFALAFVLCGPGALEEQSGGALRNDFLKAFFFSVQTIATIGFGHIHPVGLPANLIVTVESLFGLLSFALATGLLFARFSKPTARILFSDKAVVAPYREIKALEFRIANARKSQIIELEAKVLFSRLEGLEGQQVRRFYPLTLERDKVAFFPLSWTLVHPINETSPLSGSTYQDLYDSDAEFLVLLTGVDENFSELVHARSSYKPGELVWGAKFLPIFTTISPHQPISIDIRKLSHIETIREGI